MNLLPKSHHEFSDAEYWNSFFRKRGKKAFEWYGGYTELCDVLHKYVRPKDEILEIGCGNSDMAARLHDAGYTHTTSIDISPVVVRQMQQKRPDVRYEQMDALHMTFAEGTFSAVLDKGTMDALVPSEADRARGERLCAEVMRVTRAGGRFLCISLLQKHIARLLLEQFATLWLVRVVRCPDSEASALPVFAVVCTKAVVPLQQPLLELCLAGEHVQRVVNITEMLAAIRSVQQVALVCTRLQQRALDTNTEVSFDLLETAGTVRYTVYVLEQQAPTSVQKQQPYGAFIVPQGRETEWLFGTEAGRRQLAHSAHCRRLAVVTLHRDHHYASLDAVKEELANAVQSFAPALQPGQQIPFLSVGEDIGRREMRLEGHSTVSGAFVIEDCSSENDTFRRLVFLSNQNVVQSEARLQQRGATLEVDPLYLACHHHVPMSVGCEAAVSPDTREGGTNVLVVGLGGGGLCTFLARCLTDAHITAVDLDPIMRDVAIEWFGLQLNERLHVHIADGLEYLREAAARRDNLNAILFDVDSKDTSVGLSCPPAAFLEHTTLQHVHTCLSDNIGLLVVNVVARDRTLETWALQQLGTVFSALVTYQVPDELNQVVFCSKNGTTEQLVKRLGAAAATLDAAVRKQQRGGRRRPRAPPLLDIDEFKSMLTAFHH